MTERGRPVSRRSVVALAAVTASVIDAGTAAVEYVGGRGLGSRDGAAAAPAPTLTPGALRSAAADRGPSVLDVTLPPFNVVADGVTDWSAVLATAAKQLAEVGGGVVALPAGTIIAEGIPVYSRVAWEGAGMGTTVVKLRPGSTKHVFMGDGFEQLTGTSKQAGVLNWAIRHLTIDGNRSECPQGGDGIAVFGYEFFVSDVLVRACHGSGVYLEFHDQTAYKYTDTLMESYVDRVKVMDCDGNGFWINGCHDSYFTGLIAARNGFDGLSNFHITGSHNNFVGCHAWGAAAYGWLIDGEAYLYDCQGEGATIADFAITGDDVQIVGGRCYWPERGSGGVSTGILVGTATRKVENLQIRGMVVNRGSADDPNDFRVGLDVTHAGDGCYFDLSVAQVSGNPITGPFPADAYVNVRVNAGKGWTAVTG